MRFIARVTPIGGNACTAMILERSYFHEAESDGRFSLEICSLQVIYRIRHIKILISARVGWKIAKKLFYRGLGALASSTGGGGLSANSGPVCYLHLITIVSHFNRKKVYIATATENDVTNLKQ